MNNDYKYGHCPMCGSPLEEDGICTKLTCKRRKLQLKIKALQDSMKKKQEEAHKEK